MPTVTVASKLAHDLELQCSEKNVERIQGQNGVVWQETTYRKGGPRVTIRGTAYPAGSELPEGFPDRPAMVFGAALTYGVDADFFDRWLEEHKDCAFVKNRLVFAHQQEASVKAEAKEVEKQKSGHEPLARGKDPATGEETIIDERVPKRRQGLFGKHVRD